MNDEPSAAMEQSRTSNTPDDTGDASARVPAQFVDSHQLAVTNERIADPSDFLTDGRGADATEGGENATGAAENSTGEGAIDALRAATTAADTHAPQLAPHQINEIVRLHEAAAAADLEARRLFGKPGARKRLNRALALEAGALHAHGYASFDDLAEALASAPAQNAPAEGSAETIARIEAMLAEIGIDGGADPLEAARIFLTTHEADEAVEGTIDQAPAAEAPATPVTGPTTDAPATGAPEPALELATEPTVEAPAPVVGGPEADGPEADVVVAEATEVDSEAPWVPAAQLPPNPQAPPAAESAPRDRDDDVIDRWIHAEARAERMHAEVDRAQAELVSLLARSADLEQTVVARADERDSAHAELELTKARVAELERTIAKSTIEREDLERALTVSRGRVAELDAIVTEREAACNAATSERTVALATVAELESNLAARTAELEQARASVSDLEIELTTQAAHLDQARGELGTARANVDELRTELENTRRSLDALDAHAETIEAELAEARRKADSPETRRELEGVRQELLTARGELVALELRRTETEATLARDRAELEQLQRDMATTQDSTHEVRNDLSVARGEFETTSLQLEAAERAREAITIDAADILARAEAEAANLLERASRDAEAIRQEALLDTGSRPQYDADAIPQLAEQVAKLERKLAKQRRRLDDIIEGAEVKADAAPRKASERAAKPNAADIIASAEREAIDIRRAVRRDRERFRDELVGLLNRLAPLSEDEDEDDDE